jgi:hypothetical protein
VIGGVDPLACSQRHDEKFSPAALEMRLYARI